MQKFKSSKPGVHLEPMALQAFKEGKKLCVFEHLKEYISRTRDLRNGQSQLFISYNKPHKPISRNTVSRWTKQVMKSAGLDITIYSSHSTRAASTSSCKANSFSVEEITKVAGWSNSGRRSHKESLLVLCTGVGVGCHYKRLTAIPTITNQETIFQVL